MAQPHRTYVTIATILTSLLGCGSTPTPSPWPADLLKYEANVNTTMVDELLSYARDQLTSNFSAIQLNLLSSKLRGATLDLLWPGSSFGAVAAGGQFEVLALLATYGEVVMGNIMGASGGATSTIFALADNNASSRELLRSYDVSAQWLADHPEYFVTVLLYQPDFFKTQYEYAIREDDSFARVCKQRGYVSLTMEKGRPFGSQGQWVLSNFTSRQQCADTVFASGEASAKGEATGDDVEGLKDLYGTGADGGELTTFDQLPGGVPRPVVFYHTIFDDYDMITITPETIRKLYKRGVDDTIKMLRNPTFVVPKQSNGQGGMVLARSGTFAELAQLGWSLAKKGTFLNIGPNKATSFSH